VSAIAGPVPSDELELEPIPISALQHAIYCLRQAALIHIERLWVENRFTAEGRVLHTSADEPGHRKVRGVRRVNALPIANRRLGIAGVADLVEFHHKGEAEVPFPIEIKRGKPKLHRADQVQLCAQALCLEEMTGIPVPEGALFYAETKRRDAIAFDADLRRLTEDTIAELRIVFVTLATPPPTPHKARCKSCSLRDVCRPEAAVRPVFAWRRRAVDRLLAEAEPPP
jgi:CRISPR-associated exonuclease Cas4